MDTKKTKGTTAKPKASGTARASDRRKPSQASAQRRPSQAPARKVPARRRTPAPEQTPVKKRSARPASKAVRPSAPAQPLPEVVYTPGKPFNGRRVLLHMTTIVAVVLAISFGISVFFKVEVITVSGTDKYDVWTVKEASGIEEGENLLSFGKAKAAGKIKTALPYVESVRIGIKLPDTVNIEIKELDVVYAIKDAVEQWWLMTSDGKVVDKADLATAGDYTQILGVKLATPVAGAQAVAQEEVQTATEATDGIEMPSVMPVVTANDKLQTALKILQYMEDCRIIGEAANVDVGDLGNIELQYGQRFEVKLGDTSQLLYKIKCMDAAINGKEEHSLKEYDSGVLDISFTIKEDQIIYQASEE